jgi:uncharacterized protein YuzE
MGSEEHDFPFGRAVVGLTTAHFSDFGASMFTYDYDHVSDCLYVELSQKPAISSRNVCPNITQKLDANGVVVAYDIKQASKVVGPFFASLGIDTAEAFAA